jgi:hypothetical protein
VCWVYASKAPSPSHCCGMCSHLYTPECQTVHSRSGQASRCRYRGTAQVRAGLIDTALHTCFDSKFGAVLPPLT